MCNHFYRIFDLWNRFDLCNDFLIFSLLSSFFTPTFWLLCFQLFLLISFPLFESSVFRYFDSYWLLSFWFIDSSVFGGIWLLSFPHFQGFRLLSFKGFLLFCLRHLDSSLWGISTLMFKWFFILFWQLPVYRLQIYHFQFKDLMLSHFWSTFWLLSHFQGFWSSYCMFFSS